MSASVVVLMKRVCMLILFGPPVVCSHTSTRTRVSFVSCSPWERRGGRIEVTREENGGGIHSAALTTSQDVALPLRPASLLSRFSAKYSPWLMIQNLSISSAFLHGTRPAIRPHLHSTTTSVNLLALLTYRDLILAIQSYLLIWFLVGKIP